MLLWPRELSKADKNKDVKPRTGPYKAKELLTHVGNVIESEVECRIFRVYAN